MLDRRLFLRACGVRGLRRSSDYQGDEDAEIEVIDARGLSWRERQALRREIERQEQAWRKLGRVLRDLIWLAALSAGLS